MVTVDKAIIARIERNGKHFEVLVDPETAYELKQGRPVSISNMIAVNDVFTDSKKGLKASEKTVEEAFGTNDIDKVVETIVKNGDMQVTTAFRQQKTDERRKEISNMISKYAHDPKTNLPHPSERILNAMEQVHVSIDPFVPASQQVDDIIKALKQVLPISVDEITLKIEVSARYSGSAFNALKKIGTLKKHNWLSDGSLLVEISIPSGSKESVYRTLNSVTEGSVKISE